MPLQFDQRTGRIFLRVVGLSGMNTLSPPRSLAEGESSYAMGVRAKEGKISPCKESTGVEAFAVFAPAEQINWCVEYKTTTPYVVLLGTTKCWVQQSGNPVDKTPTIPFTTHSNVLWHGHTMLTDGAPVVVVNNRGVNVPHYWNGGAGLFLPLSNAPNMRCMIGYLGRLFGGDVQPDSLWYNNRLQWSAEGDITTWIGATSGDTDLEDEGDPIKRLALLRGNLLLILRTGSIYVTYPTGDPGAPIVAPQRFANRGMLAPSSLQMLEESYIFLGEDDIYEVTPSSLDRVGSKVRTDLFRDTDADKLQYAWSYLDAREKEYYLVTQMTDGTQRAWIYNYEYRMWAMQDLTGYTMLFTWRED